MFVIKGQPGKDVCDRSLGVTRRDLLRVGGAGMLGLSLGSMMELQAAAKGKEGGPGWGKDSSLLHRMCLRNFAAAVFLAERDIQVAAIETSDQTIFARPCRIISV